MHLDASRRCDLLAARSLRNGLKEQAMLYRMREVLDLVERHGFQKATELAFAIRLEEIAKAWKWPNRAVTIAFGTTYFLMLLLVSVFLPKAKVSDRQRRILRDLAELYYYIPEIVLFKGLELDAVCSGTYAGRGLDLGCGNGLTGTAFMGMTGVRELHGVDRGSYFAATEYASYIAGDACNLPYATNTFDFLISLGVIDHVPDLDSLLRESCRVLKPGGHLTYAIQTRHFRESTFWYRTFRWFGRHEEAEAFKMYRDVYDMIFHYYSEQDWRAHLVAAGFDRVEIGYIFSGRHLFFYDLLNMQTYFLKYFYAERAQRFIAKHPFLRCMVIRAVERVTAHLLQRAASPEDATRYLIRAFKSKSHMVAAAPLSSPKGTT